jgi:hypothetical protein
MKMNTQVLLQSSMVLLLLAGPFVPAVSAASTLVGYNFSGTLTTVTPNAQKPVSQGGLGIAVGDFITGAFSYDSSQTGSGGVYTYTGSPKIHTFSFAIYTDSSKTTQLFTDKYSGNVTAFYQNQVTFISSTAGTTLQILGDTIFKSALGISGPAGMAFDLTLTNPTSAGGYTMTNLPNPTPTLVKNFVGVNGKLAWDNPGLGFTSDNLVFSIPEPSSAALAGIGIAACAAGVVTSRRKARRVLSKS